MKPSKVAQFIAALRAVGVTQFSCADFQVSFECPHGKESVDHNTPIGFRAESSDEDDD